jgi:acetoin utilization protein AcuB
MASISIDQYMTPAPHTIGAEQTVASAHQTMKELNVRHLPVLHGGELLGVVSDRDIAVVMGLKDAKPGELSVEDAIPLVPFTVAPTTPLSEVAQHMADHKFGSAVVMRGREVLGIFTTVDACRALADLTSAR